MSKIDLLHKLLKEILKEHTAEEKFYEYLVNLLQYRTVFLERESTYSLYSLRRDIGERSVEQLVQFDTVLMNMSKYTGAQIIIHTIQFPEEFYLFFTDTNVVEYLGYIVFPYRRVE